MIHARLGDPPETVGSGFTTSSGICMCACQRCSSGDCCQFSTGLEPGPTTWVASGTAEASPSVYPPPAERLGCYGYEPHRYTTRDGIVFCERCGRGPAKGW